MILAQEMQEGEWESEVERIQQAAFTEPDDQSIWFYYKWILQQVPKEYSIDALKTQMAWLEELMEVEPTCKWPKVRVLILLVGRRMMMEFEFELL